MCPVPITVSQLCGLAVISGRGDGRISIYDFSAPTHYQELSRLLSEQVESGKYNDLFFNLLELKFQNSSYFFYVQGFYQIFLKIKIILICKVSSELYNNHFKFPDKFNGPHKVW